MRRPSVLCLIPLLVCVAGPAATQVLIDNFEEGAFSLSIAPAELLQSDTQMNLAPENVLSEIRQVQLFSLSQLEHGGASLDLELTGGDDALDFAADGPLGQGIDVEYPFTLPLDLPSLGNEFSVELEALSDPMNDVTVLVFVTDTKGGASVAAVEPSQTGTLVFPFLPESAFVPDGEQAADFSDAINIVLSLTTTVEAVSDVSASLDDFQIVPEPSSCALAGAALLSLVGMRRMRAA